MYNNLTTVLNCLDGQVEWCVVDIGYYNIMIKKFKIGYVSKLGLECAELMPLFLVQVHCRSRHNAKVL